MQGGLITAQVDGTREDEEAWGSGTSLRDPDSDDDGWEDYWEHTLDYNPLDPNHYPEGNVPPGGC